MNKTLLYKYSCWVLLVCGLAALTALLIYLHYTPMTDDILVMKRVEFSTQQSTDLPKPDTIWTPTTLPDDWWFHQSPGQEGWYRITLTLNVPPNRLWGIYLHSVTMNAAVYLNNELLGTGGRFRDPVARNWNRPLYFAIPNGLLKPGDNTFLIRVKTESPSNGLLANVYLGPAESLLPVYERRLLVRYGFSQVIVVMSFVASGFLLVLWSRRRADTVYLWFALTILAWAIHNLSLIVINIPMSTRQWVWLNSSSLTWLPICAIIFIRRLLGAPAQRHERVIVLLGIVATLLLAAIPEAEFYRYGILVNSVFALLLGLYPVTYALRNFIQTRSGDIFLLMASGTWMLLLGVYDNLFHMHLINREYGLIMHYSAPLILFVFVSILLKRFVGALNESELLNLSLESNINKKHLDLENNYKKLRTLENQQLLIEERERILRDMHDGMGGHLVSTLALVDNGVADRTILRSSLQQALDDLRLMIDSMEDVDGDVLTVLGMLRQRLESRLTQAGITLHWQVQNLPAIEGFGPQKALHVMRILQEGITNIIKHAQSLTITLSTGESLNAQGAEGVFIQLCDAGTGFCVEEKFQGRGMHTMQRRANLIGGQLTMHSSTSGSCLQLWLPLR